MAGAGGVYSGEEFQNGKNLSFEIQQSFLQIRPYLWTDSQSQ